MASQIGVDDKECTLQCVKSGAKYVLATKVDGKSKSLMIQNQDFPELEKHAGEMVRVTGDMKGGAVVVSRVEKAPDAK